MRFPGAGERIEIVLAVVIGARGWRSGFGDF
jgi:hypothetical protein